METHGFGMASTSGGDLRALVVAVIVAAVVGCWLALRAR